MNNGTKLKLFEMLWKLVFILDNEECKINRFENYLLIKLIVDKNKENCLNYFKHNKNNFKNEINPLIAEYFLRFIFEFKEFYKLLDSITLNIIKKQYIERPVLKIYDINNYGDLDTYFHMIINTKNDVKVTVKVKHTRIYAIIEFVIDILLKRNDNEKIIIFICNLYSKSPSYDEANFAFNLVKNHLDKFKKSDIENLLLLSEENNQTYNRKGAKEDYFNLISYCNSENININFNQFINFTKAIT